MTDKQIKEYKEKLKKNEEKTYASYLSTDGIRTEEKYHDSLRSAETQKRLNDTNYGALASSLASIGLSRSGYEDYLKKTSEASYSKSKTTADENLAINKHRNISGYEKYLSDYELLQNKISKSVIDEIGSGNDFDYEAAYRKAIDAGISEDMAAYTASEGINKAIVTNIEKAITFSKLNSLTPQNAKKYAKSLGLDEIYSNKVYEAIATFTQEEKYYFSSMTSDGYYNYIMSEANKN